MGVSGCGCGWVRAFCFEKKKNDEENHRIIAQINGPSLKEEEVQSLKNKYPEAFSGKLGKLKNQSIKLDIYETIRPIKQITREIEKCRGKRAVGYGEIRYY